MSAGRINAQGPLAKQTGVVLWLVLLISVGMALLVMTAARQSQLMQAVVRHHQAIDQAQAAAAESLQRLRLAWLREDPAVVVWPLSALSVVVADADCTLEDSVGQTWSALPWQAGELVQTLVVQAPARCQYHAEVFNAEGEAVVAEVVIALVRSAWPSERVTSTLLRRPYRQAYPAAQPTQRFDPHPADVDPDNAWPCPAVYVRGPSGLPKPIGRQCPPSF